MPISSMPLFEKSYGTWIVTVTRPNGSTYGGHLYVEVGGPTSLFKIEAQCVGWGTHFCKGGEGDEAGRAQVIIGL